MSEYESNSYKSRQENSEDKKDIRPVVKGKVTTKKEPLSRKFSDVFLSDTTENVKSYLVYDVIVPAVKDLIVDMISNGTNMLIFGSSNASRSRSRTGSYAPRNYATTYQRSTDRDHDRRYDRPNYSKNRYGYHDIFFDNRTDAKEVMDSLLDICEHYKMVSVAEYYELSGAEELEVFTDRDYGWFDLASMTIARDVDGYHLKLPRPEYLK